MVLFINVNVGQRVDVYLWNIIYTGTVRYKGCVVSQKGDWVGVELDQPVGTHCGLYRGRRYFQCWDKHGIFVRANRLRFKPTTRCLYNSYRTIKENEDFRDDTLFRRTIPEVKNSWYDPIAITDIYNGRTESEFKEAEDMFAPRRSYHLSHSVSNSIPAVTMLTRPRTAALSYSSRPIHTEYGWSQDDDYFISSPTIPKTHMPFTALKRQVRRGWENAHYTREMSVPSGRDSIKIYQWNDISE